MVGGNTTLHPIHQDASAVPDIGETLADRLVAAVRRAEEDGTGAGGVIQAVRTLRLREEFDALLAQ